jgi:hypothetical protein
MKEKDMNLGLFKPKMEAKGSPSLRLELDRPGDPTPLVIPVFIQSLSMGGVTVATTNPWGVPDWNRYRGENCLLRLEDPGSTKVINIKAKLTWTKLGSTGQLPLSLGLQLVKPSSQALRRLSNLLTHSSQDIKGLWDRYDQVRKIPGPAPLAQRCYNAGLVLLAGGLALQFSGSLAYQRWGWVLWLLGSLGIAGKIIQPLWQKWASGDQIGKTL